MTVPPPDPARPRVLWFFGPDAVGKSAVGWEAYRLLGAADVPVAYLDTDYLGFADPPPSDPAVLVAANLAAVWPVFADHGASCLVVSGIVVTAADQDRFQAAIPAASFVYCGLTATDSTLRRRVFARREVEAASRGGQLTTAERAELDAYARRGAQFAARLDEQRLADFNLATDDRSPAESAAAAVVRCFGAAGQPVDRPTVPSGA